MANRIETATVTGETIKLSSNDAGAAGSFNAVSLAFTFDAAWDGTTSKIVQFLDAYGANPVNITLGAEMLVSGAYIVPIPAEPLVYAGEINVTVRGVDFEIDGTTAERIIMSASAIMKVKNSLYKVGGATPVEPTPTQAEQLLTAVSSVTGMTVSATALATGAPATVTKTTNVDETINLAFGLPAGGKGDTGNTGSTGATGNGISSVVLNGDYTLTINFTDSTSTTTTSIRGATGATGAKGDTGATGNGIASIALISGNHAAGTTDTYRITFTDTTTFDFTVYNGADGEGAGDMLASVYDPNSKNADAFSLANMVGDTTHRVVTDTEKTTWNAKQSATDTLTAETALVDGDYIPFYDTSATAHKKTLWSNIKSVLKTYFDTLYATLTHAHGNITNDGKIGTTADLIVATTTAGEVTTKTVADTKTLLGITDNSYVKLLETEVGTAVASITLDLSGLTMTNYTQLVVLLRDVKASATDAMRMRINGITATSYYHQSISATSATSAAFVLLQNYGYLSAEKYSSGEIRIGYDPTQTSEQPVLINYVGGVGAGSSEARLGICNATTSAGVTSITIYTAGGNTIAVGSKFVVYGVSA